MNDTTTLTEADAGAIPTIEAVVLWLMEIADVESLDPDGNLQDQGVDSLDLIELGAAIEEKYGVILDETVLEEALSDNTLRQVYDRVIAQFSV